MTVGIELATRTRRVLRDVGEVPEMVRGELHHHCREVDFDGERFIFSKRAILTLVVSSVCNAGCHFCSNEITFTPKGFLRPSDDLQRVKDFALLAGVTKIAYSGGEPTLNAPALAELVAFMNPGFRTSRIHTNGFGLFRKVPGRTGEVDLLDRLIALGLTGASVSVAHYDTELNRQIMVLPRSWGGMDTDTLTAVADRTSSTFTPRLSCVMTHNGVNSVEGMFAYMEWGRAMGFRRFIFRTCSDIPDDFQKPTAFSRFNTDNYMAIDPLSEQILRRPGVELTYRQRKTDSKVDVFTWQGLTFDVDESSEEPDPDSKIRRINVMPDGIAYTSWIDPDQVLFSADRVGAERRTA